MISDQSFWILTVLLGIGTFLIRFSFLGLLGNRPLPEWVLRHLRYVGVAVFPALVIPLILWPETLYTPPDPARLIAAALTLIVALRIGIFAALLTGMLSLYGLSTLF